MLASYGCCNKWSQSWWLKQRFWRSEIRYQFQVPLCYKVKVSIGLVPSGGSERRICFSLFLLQKVAYYLYSFASPLFFHLTIYLRNDALSAYRTLRWLFTLHPRFWYFAPQSGHLSFHELCLFNSARRPCFAWLLPSGSTVWRDPLGWKGDSRAHLTCFPLSGVMFLWCPLSSVSKQWFHALCFCFQLFMVRGQVHPQLLHHGEHAKKENLNTEENDLILFDQMEFLLSNKLFLNISRMLENIF